MDALATILLRRAGAVALPAPAAAPPADGDAWVANLEADLAATAGCSTRRSGGGSPCWTR
ncbi:hypothetical protein AB0F68_33395 [Micromonospora sp. NPDC023966]|uniref:hypothetical protein n=1 Tax=Micromonospora sp. NPDC023966 TaxID=3154699 RepID=UPI0033D5A3B0